MTAEHKFRFKVVKVDYNTCDITIQFIPFKENKQTTIEQGFVTNKIYADIFNKNYFLLKKVDMKNSCSEYTPVANNTLDFGTFTTPFKFRPTKSLFTNNLSLGTSIIYQNKFLTDWSYGGVGGISLTSVSLDSLSTNYKVKTSTDRPALTFSLGGIVSYKTINFTLGLGWDYINKTSIVEQSWIFQGKPWIGFGIGNSLFNAASSTTNKTMASGAQKND